MVYYWQTQSWKCTLKVLKNFRVFHTSKTIDGLNLNKPFWVFSCSPQEKTFLGFLHEETIYGLNLKKNPFRVLLHYITGWMQVSFDQPLKEFQWMLH